MNAALVVGGRDSLVRGEHLKILRPLLHESDPQWKVRHSHSKKQVSVEEGTDDSQVGNHSKLCSSTAVSLQYLQRPHFNYNLLSVIMDV